MKLFAIYGLWFKFKRFLICGNIEYFNDAEQYIIVKRSATREEKEKQKRKHKMRIKVLKAARRSGKLSKPEGKITKSKAKKKNTISQRRMATIKKSRY